MYRIYCFNIREILLYTKKCSIDTALKKDIIIMLIESVCKIDY